MHRVDQLDLVVAFFELDGRLMMAEHGGCTVVLAVDKHTGYSRVDARAECPLCRDANAENPSAGSDASARSVAAFHDWGFNAWGGKYATLMADDRIPAALEPLLGMPRFAPSLVLEGGSIDVNGEGVLLTTEQCLLNTNRNPELAREDIEQNLRATLGVEQIVWLGDGIEGDDTDGHVDDLTRFVSPDTVVTVMESNTADPNHAALLANRRRLDEIRVAGRRLNVVELPMPDALFNDGQRLPASYANFYVANDRVLVPVFASPQDQAACAILADCFPKRRVIPIDSRALVAGLGALHCLTQQVPLPGRAADSE
jgi:agmatine deiminase